MIPIVMIFSTDPDGYIAKKDGSLVYSCKSDFAYFKEITTEPNSAVVMGRKTYESIGSPLPDRFNIVLTNNPDFMFDPELEDELDNCSKQTSIRGVLELCEKLHIQKLFVIGGAEIYKQFEELASELIITQYHTISECSDLGGIFYLPNLTKFSLKLIDNNSNKTYTDIDIKTKQEINYSIFYYKRD